MVELSSYAEQRSLVARVNVTVSYLAAVAVMTTKSKLEYEVVKETDTTQVIHYRDKGNQLFNPRIDYSGIVQLPLSRISSIVIEDNNKLQKALVEADVHPQYCKYLQTMASQIVLRIEGTTDEFWNLIHAIRDNENVIEVKNLADELASCILDLEEETAPPARL
jgi:hypothetical protein